MSERNCCTLVEPEGDCGLPVPPDAPVSACIPHMLKAYLYIRDIVEGHEGHVFEYEGTQYDVSPVAVGRSPVVYYLGFGDRIKIGTSVNLARRLGELPPGDLLAVEPGGADLEDERHEQFAADRILINREWFRDSPALLRHIAAVRDTYGDPSCAGQLHMFNLPSDNAALKPPAPASGGFSHARTEVPHARRPAGPCRPADGIGSGNVRAGDGRGDLQLGSTGTSPARDGRQGARDPRQPWQAPVPAAGCGESGAGNEPQGTPPGGVTGQMLLTRAEAAAACGVSVERIRSWERRQHLKRAGINEDGQAVYRAVEVAKAQHRTRSFTRIAV